MPVTQTVRTWMPSSSPSRDHFRLGVGHAADRLAASLAARFDRLGADSTVLFVAHSMGGLVARHWVAHHNGSARCRGMIALGTPFRGAPKALDVMGQRPLVGYSDDSAAQVVACGAGVACTARSGPDRRAGVRPRRSASGRVELVDLPHHAEYVTAREGPRRYACGGRDLDLDPDHRPMLQPFRGSGQATLSQTTWDGSRLTVSKVPLDW